MLNLTSVSVLHVVLGKNDCRPSPVNVTVKYNGCKKRIEMARCIGECKKTLK
jgi:hypothetical protein